MHHIFHQSSKNAKDDDDDARRQDEDIIKLMICFDQQIDVIKTTSNQWSHTVLYIQSNNAQFSLSKKECPRGRWHKYLNSWILLLRLRYCMWASWWYDEQQFFTSHHHQESITITITVNSDGIRIHSIIDVLYIHDLDGLVPKSMAIGKAVLCSSY